MGIKGRSTVVIRQCSIEIDGDATDEPLTSPEKISRHWPDSLNLARPVFDEARQGDFDIFGMLGHVTLHHPSDFETIS